MYVLLTTRKPCKKVSLKVSKDDTVCGEEDRLWRGRLFHICGAATENILSPYRLLDGRTHRSLLLVEHSTQVFCGRLLA